MKLSVDDYRAGHGELTENQGSAKQTTCNYTGPGSMYFSIFRIIEVPYTVC